MNKKMKVWGLVGIIVVIVIIWISISMQGQGEAIKVGVILPLSGDFSFIGEEIQKGIQIAQQETEQQGFDSEIIYEDDQSFNPISGVNAANKLASRDVVDVGITGLIEEAKPIAPIFSNAKIPLLVVWDSTEYIKEQEYLFSTGFSTELAGEKMAKYAYEDLSLRKVAVAYHIDAWAEVISESFENKFKELGGEIVSKESYLLDETDYRTGLTKIKEVNPDGVYFPMLFPTSSNFLIQARELGLDSVFMTGDAFIQDSIDVSIESAEGVYVTNIYTDESEGLTTKYEEKFGQAPIDITMVSFGYDAFNLIIDAHALESEDTLKDKLIEVIGPSKSLEREEKIYKIVDGKYEE